MKNICVFAGSSIGINPNHASAARLLGKFIAEKKFNLIYGGAKIGLMGEVASACLKSGGKVIGVIPKFLMYLIAFSTFGTISSIRYDLW